MAKTVLCDTKALNADARETLAAETLARQSIRKNARTAQDQEAFHAQNNVYLTRLQELSVRIAEIEQEKRRRKHMARILENYIQKLETSPLVLTDFDEPLWIATVEYATVFHDGKIVFKLKDGTEFE